MDFSISDADLTFRTHAGAFQTADAFTRIVEQLAAIGLALGILAPGAVQRAAFEKNEGANPGTVMG